MNNLLSIIIITIIPALMNGKSPEYDSLCFKTEDKGSVYTFFNGEYDIINDNYTCKDTVNGIECEYSISRNEHPDLVSLNLRTVASQNDIRNVQDYYFDYQDGRNIKLWCSNRNESELNEDELNLRGYWAYTKNNDDNNNIKFCFSTSGGRGDELQQAQLIYGSCSQLCDDNDKPLNQCQDNGDRTYTKQCCRYGQKVITTTYNNICEVAENSVVTPIKRNDPYCCPDETFNNCD